MRMAFEWQIKERLGAPKKLPKEFAMQKIINVAAVGNPELMARVTVHHHEPDPNAKQSPFSTHARRTVRHRVMVECPKCYKEMSMGRLNQHYPCK